MGVEMTRYLFESVAEEAGFDLDRIKIRNYHGRGPGHGHTGLVGVPEAILKFFALLGQESLGGSAVSMDGIEELADGMATNAMGVNSEGRTEFIYFWNIDTLNLKEN